MIIIDAARNHKSKYKCFISALMSDFKKISSITSYPIKLHFRCITVNKDRRRVVVVVNEENVVSLIQDGREALPSVVSMESINVSSGKVSCTDDPPEGIIDVFTSSVLRFGLW